MFGWGPATKIYLAAGATDMRKGFEGLYGLVRDRLHLEPLSGMCCIYGIELHYPRVPAGL
jgi:transposase